MSQSWNHTLRPMTEEEIDQHAGMGWTCSSPMCRGKAVYEATFDSVTGRAGRVNTRRKQLCVEHGEKFAAKNGLVAVSGEVER